MATRSKKETPNEQAIRKYEEEIAALQVKYNEANEKHDWSMRHFYANQISAKKGNLEWLLSKSKTKYTKSICS